MGSVFCVILECWVTKLHMGRLAVWNILDVWDIQYVLAVFIRGSVTLA